MNKWAVLGFASLLGDFAGLLGAFVTGIGVLGVVLEGVTEVGEGASVQSEKGRFRVPPLNMALTSSQA